MCNGQLNFIIYIIVVCKNMRIKIQGRRLLIPIGGKSSRLDSPLLYISTFPHPTAPFSTEAARWVCIHSIFQYFLLFLCLCLHTDRVKVHLQIISVFNSTHTHIYTYMYMCINIFMFLYIFYSSHTLLYLFSSDNIFFIFS